MIPEVPSWFLKTKAGAELISEHENEQSAIRKQLVAELERLTEDRQSKIPAETERIEAARTKHEAATAKAEQARSALQAAIAERSRTNFEYDRQVSQIQNQLRETCDPAIDEFIENMKALGDSERLTPIDVEEQPTWDPRRIQQRFKRTASNHGSIIRRLEAIGAAINAAESLRLSPAVNVAEELEQLRQGLPAIVMEPVT